ncbi:hypothetical protein EB001_03245 [bacterium]|nr:hypothetical protein [bacterium]
MAIKLLFDFTKSHSTETSEIYHLMDQMDIFDQNFLDNGIIHSIQSSSDITGENIHEQTYYIFDSLANFQNFLESKNSSEIENLWKSVYDARFKKGFLMKFSIDYNYVIE